MAIILNEKSPDKDWVEHADYLESKLPEQGTKEYARALHLYVIQLQDFPRKDDLQITVTGMYIQHYMKWWESRNHKKFKAEDIFKIRIPDWIKNISKNKLNISKNQ